MCWNADISLKTFLFGLATASILYLTDYKNKTMILVVLSFTSMQFIEYLTWTYINDKKINRYLSIIAFTTIFIQLLLINYFLPNKKYRNILLLLLITAFITFCLFQLKNIDFSMKKGANGHLQWNWLKVPVIWLCIGLLFYLVPTFLSEHRIYFIITFGTLAISLYYWYKYDTWGSMWCYISNLLWILMICNHLYHIYCKTYKK